ncbi:hypothetical protein D1872_236020 [compost metagenome]
MRDEGNFAGKKRAPPHHFSVDEDPRAGAVLAEVNINERHRTLPAVSAKFAVIAQSRGVHVVLHHRGQREAGLQVRLQFELLEPVIVRHVNNPAVVDRSRHADRQRADSRVSVQNIVHPLRKGGHIFRQCAREPPLILHFALAVIDGVERILFFQNHRQPQHILGIIGKPFGPPPAAGFVDTDKKKLSLLFHGIQKFADRRKTDAQLPAQLLLRCAPHRQKRTADRAENHLFHLFGGGGHILHNIQPPILRLYKLRLIKLV